MISFASFTTKARLAMLVSAGALALAAPGSALAAPAGDEGPDHCTFEKGVTICEFSETTIETEVSEPDPVTGCVTTTIYDTTIFWYTAHRGTYNSNGRPVEPPPAYGLGGASFSIDCPD